MFRLILLVIAALAAAAPLARARPIERMTLYVPWVPAGEYAGYYAAAIQGRYASSGIDIAIVHGGREGDGIAAVARGDAQIGCVEAAEVVLARAAGIPIRAIAAIHQRSDIMFIAPRGLGIVRPEQFAGRVIRVTPGMEPTLRAMMAPTGIAPGDWREVDLPSDPALFIAGRADVWTVSVIGLPAELRARNIPFDAIFPDDYRVHAYSQVLVVREDFLRTHADALREFLRASIEGEIWSLQYPDSAARLVRHYDRDADLTAAARRIIASTPLVYADDRPIGWMRAEEWGRTVAALVPVDQRVARLRPEDLFTPAVLAQAYAEIASRMAD